MKHLYRIEFVLIGFLVVLVIIALCKVIKPIYPIIASVVVGCYSLLLAIVVNEKESKDGTRDSGSNERTSANREDSNGSIGNN